MFSTSEYRKVKRYIHGLKDFYRIHPARFKMFDKSIIMIEFRNGKHYSFSSISKTLTLEEVKEFFRQSEH